MISAFVKRRPWAAIVITCLFSPIFGMLYLGKGRCAAAYFFAMLLIFAVPAIAARFDLLPLPAGVVIVLLGLIHFIAGTVHCCRIAKYEGGQRPAVWFARWYSLLGFFLALLAPAILLHKFL